MGRENPPVKKKPGVPSEAKGLILLGFSCIALLSLLSYIKYGREKGKVQVSLSQQDALVVATVRDDGEGIAPNAIPRLTERFYRVDVKRSRERGGTGLGLAIVKHIVNRHQGRLSIESKLGVGSTFTVFLPAAPAEPPVKTSQAEPVTEML